MATNDNNNDDDEKAAKRMEMFASLHEEVELARYATCETGQARRKVPRAESAIRNKKRKLLDKADHDERRAVPEEQPQARRLRGSQISLENRVVDASKVLGYDGEEEEEPGETEQEEMELEVNEEESQEEDDEQEAEVVDDEEEVVAGNEVSAPAVKPSNSTKTTKAKPREKSKKRLMYRMRNFKSARMAERHGDALGAHARGMSLQAVRKLEQVAEDAPAAPQVYSSLGMVYESLLSDSRKRTSVARSDQDVSIKSIEKQLELAKKAYGSYHVAALLCKKDFSLWVRAGDTAKEIADLYTEAMTSSEATEAAKRNEYRQEKKKWIEEAKKDYLAADNQRPPGIDVPAKLAAAQMELGNLSEALVILTDLKNRAPEAFETHSEFEKSYKAWLLYADLMLRIGHECTQWNKGDQQNENYMFRRWLRKWSISFDWKERRLHALLLALEAAAGTKCCSRLIRWSKSRVASQRQDENGTPIGRRRWHVDQYEIAKDPPAAAKQQGDEQGKDDSEGDAAFAMSKQPAGDSSSTWSLDRARSALFAKNALELEVFDQETQNLHLDEGSEEWQQRKTAREDLVKWHRKSVVELVGNYKQHHVALETAAATTVPNTHVETNGNSSQVTEALPITGSCAVVCSIASELMKHCLRYELYEGCRLSGEAVSAYLKERAGLLERRLESNKTFEERQKSTAESVLLSIETYDEVDNDDSDDDEDALYLSDDEVILDSSDESLVPSLKHGILPPELRVLYGLSLIGEGGRAFLAKQCVKAIEALEADDVAALIRDPIDTDIVQDPLWYGFRHDLTEPLGRTAAFASAVDVLHKEDKEAEFAELMAPMLQKHLDSLESSGQIDVALYGSESAVSNLAAPMRNRVIKLLLASSRMQIGQATTIATSQEQDAIDICLSVLDRVIPLLRKFWKVEENGSIPSFCVTGMELVAKTFALLSNLTIDDQIEARVFAKLLEILSLFCGAVIPDPLNTELAPNAENPFKDASTYPIAVEWQNKLHELMSKRFYNIAISCNVSNFSGWETEEFTLDLLRASRKKRYFGVDISGERVSGYISQSTEAELADQWEQIGKLLPPFSGFDFKSSLDAAKASGWYKKTTMEAGDGESLSVYGEKNAFALFLMLSRLCLKAANASASDSEKYFALIKLALSIVLPVTEFCLNMHLWNSTLGKAALSKTSEIVDWTKLAKSVTPPGEGSSRRVRPPLPAKPPVEPKRRPLPTMVCIPASKLLLEWHDGTTPPKKMDSKEAKEAMQNVNQATKQLRECFTETAVQKGCTQVALALMNLIAKGYCYNPFLCLQQAALFASQGSKGGNSDEAFKEGLPKERECTPEEALVIIGRADCLQSLLFADEAVYLCSYVARVCGLHRSREETTLEWNSKWKVVGICLYNLSVAIRSTRSFQHRNAPSEDWDKVVVEELKRARADGVAMQSTLSSMANVAAIDDDDDDDDEQGESQEDEDAIGASIAAAEHEDDDDVEMIGANDAIVFPSNGMLPSLNGGGLASGDEEEQEEQEIVAV